jgi:hypothetical protein
MPEINTRHWPSIEQQANPARYKWTPKAASEPGEGEKDSG